LTIFKKIQSISQFISFIFIVFILQGVSIFEIEKCRDKLIEDKKCKFIEKTKLTFPGKYLYENLNNLNLLRKFKSSSGLITKPGTHERFKNLNSGFTFYYEPGSRNNAGYILLSKGDVKKNGEPSVELWDLNNQKLLYKWIFNTKKILGDTKLATRRPNSIKFLNPLLLSDGSLIVNEIHDSLPLLKLSPKGNLIKLNKKYKFHHSLDIDSQGKIYVPIRMENSPSGLFEDEGFAILDQELKIIKAFSLSKIYKDAGLDYKIYSTPTKDPFHINDVAPLRDPNKTKIVLLSLRSSSSIVAFNLEKEKIIWIIEGLTNRQHDVDILNKDGSYISIFDNNNYMGGKPKRNKFITIKNLPSLDENKAETIIYSYPFKGKNSNDLIVKEVNFNFKDKKMIPVTNTEGVSEYLINNNSIFIEESNYGRAFEINSKNNKLLWEYINRNDINNLYYRMTWSRRLPFVSDEVLSKLITKN